MKKDFEYIDHTADIKIRVYGVSKQELFKNALLGMFQSVSPQSSECQREGDRLVCKKFSVSQSISIQSPDLAALLVDFLSEALALSAIHNQVYFDVSFDTFTDTSLKGTVYGVSVSGLGESEVKAVTYHDMHIILKDGLWQTDIVFDI